MNSRNALTSKVAAAALAFGLVQAASVSAQETAAPLPSTNTTATTTAPQPELSASWSVAVDPLVPIALIAGMGALYAAFTLLGASRKMRGAWFRAAAGGVLAVTLINPEIVSQDRENFPTEVVIVVDKSASQTLDGRQQATDEAYAQVLRQLSGLHGVNIRTVEVAAEKNGQIAEGTDLFAALENNLHDVPRDRLGAVILLTDGQVHDIPPDLKMLGDNVPLHVLLSGRERETDRRIVIDQAPRFGLTSKAQTIRFRVLDDGVAKGTSQPVSVVITSEGKEIARQSVIVGQPAEIEIKLPRAGSNIIDISAEALAGELTTVNNRAAATIEGIHESLNVLLISGAPDAGTRMWRDLIKADPDSNLIHFTILRPPEKQDNTPLKELALIPVPTHEIFAQKLNGFNLVIFDHYNYDGLLPAAYLNNINRYVREGGALLVVSGPDYAGEGSLYKTPLASILPAAPTGKVIDTPYAPRVSTLGQRHPVTRNLNASNATPPQWGRWQRLIETQSAKGNVVMQGAEDKPLLILDRQEKGRVAMLMSDQAWLWARGHEGGGPHTALLQNISQWLTKSPLFEEESLKLQQQGNDLVIEQQTMGDKGNPVTIRTPSGKTIEGTPKQVSPGLWRITLPVTEPGMYSAVQQGQNVAGAFANVTPRSPKDYLHTLSTPDLLKPVAESSGGAVTRMMDANGKVIVPRIEARPQTASRSDLKGNDWIGVRMTDAGRIMGVQGSPLLPGWAGFLLVVGLLAAAWHKEGGGSLKDNFWKKKTQQPGPS